MESILTVMRTTHVVTFDINDIIYNYNSIVPVLFLDRNTCLLRGRDRQNGDIYPFSFIRGFSNILPYSTNLSKIRVILRKNVGMLHAKNCIYNEHVDPVVVSSTLAILNRILCLMK